MLDGMPPVEHASFLGHWLYLLVQVHDAYLVSHYTRHAVWFASSAQGCPPRLWQAMYPEARVGKLTGMLLEQDVDQIVPLLFLPEMVRSTSPSSSPAVAMPLTHSPTRPQLLDKVKEAQRVLDLAHSAADDDRPEPDPGAKSADGLEARAHTRACTQC